MQLDIFADSDDVMRRNDVADALIRGQPGAARQALQVLGTAWPDDAALPFLAVLVSTLETDHAPGARTRLTSHAELQAARRDLHDVIEPAARQTLGAAAEAWLEVRWAGLAERSAALSFDVDRAQEHAAPLWLRARRWQAAADAAGGIESWRRIPVPLGWMVQARHRLGGLHAVWPLLAELAWLAPTRFDAVARELADPVLDRLRKAFDARWDGASEAGDLVWFPAWLLTERPALAEPLGLVQPGVGSAPEQALHLLLDLLVLERQGRHHDLVERRRRLLGLQPALFKAYMATR